MAFTGALEDRLAIRERIDSYADATTQGDRDAWLACWAEDAIWRLPGQERRGRAALADAWTAQLGAVECMIFLAEVGHIAVEGDRADARCIVREVVRYKDGRTAKFAATYTDRLVRQGGDWLFAERTYRSLIREID